MRFYILPLRISDILDFVGRIQPMNRKYILTTDQGYRVKVRTPYAAVSASFSVKKYGSEEQALKAAVAWRDNLLAKHQITERLNSDHSPHYSTTVGNNPIIGVHLARATGNYAWIAKYGKGKGEKKRSFSCAKYGSKGAFLKACETRYEYAGTLHVIDKDLMPCKPTVPYRLILKDE